MDQSAQPTVPNQPVEPSVAPNAAGTDTVQTPSIPTSAPPEHPQPIAGPEPSTMQPQANPVVTPQAPQQQPIPASADPNPPISPSYSGSHIEAEPIAIQTESVPLVELKEDHELEPDVEGWLEKVERSGAVAIPGPVQDDQGNIVLADSSAQIIDDKIVLPMTEEQAIRGIKAKVTDSARWLAIWCGRIIKKFGDQVQYASQRSKSEQ